MTKYKIATYNVNGIRSALSKGLADWLTKENPDVVCFQEIKADLASINNSIFEQLGYHCYWKPAQKKGYSGVGIISKIKALEVMDQCGNSLYDNEGRFLMMVTQNLAIASTYHPSGTTGDDRQAFKMQWLDFYHSFAHKLLEKYPNLILSGDYNICNKPIDIHNPVSNANSSGFLPEEREWMDRFIASGFVDSFRMLNPNPHQYTWWSFRAGARERNLGWRIDYNMVSANLQSNIKNAYLCPNDKHSDHCACILEIEV